MTPIFVQTDNCVVDVAKITHMNVKEDRVDLHFIDGSKVGLKMPDAEQLLNGIDKLSGQRLLVAHRCPALPVHKKTDGSKP